MQHHLRVLSIFCLILAISCNNSVESPFVQVRDGHFVLNDKNVSFMGTNFWYGAILASEGQGGDRDRLARELDTLNALGIKNLRVLVGGDGPDGVYSRIEPTLQKQPGVYNDTILTGLDYLLAELAERDMKAVLFINNAWEWSGGFSMYLEWATGEPALIPALDGYTPFMTKMADFNVNREAQELFFDNLRHIVSRTNTVTGLPYSEDPAIFSWQICNEPRPFSEKEAVVDGFCDWIFKAAAIIKEIDPNHMVSTGNEGAMGCNNGDYGLTERLNSCPDIDYITAHIWPYNWSWVSSDAPQKGISNAIDNTGDYIDKHLEVARRLSKPLVIEEFGFPRDDFEYSRTSPTTGRDAYYRYVFSRLVESHSTGDLLAGVNFWGWGGFAAQNPDHSDWHRGDDYSGDPAQEAQGLNSVYATDYSTLDVIHEAVESLSGLSVFPVLENDWMLDRSKPLRVSVAGVGSPVTVRLSVSTDTGEPVTEVEKTVRKDGVVAFGLSLEDGFYNVDVFAGDKRYDSLVIGYGDPERIVSEQDAHEDFQEFWEGNLSELALVAPDYALTPLPEYSDDVRRTYRVDMTSWGGERIAAYLCEPVAEGKYPAYVTFLGYNSMPYPEDPSASPETVRLILSTRGMGLCRREGEPDNFVRSGLESPQTYYYRGAYLDCIRGLDFLCSRSNVDSSRVYAEGGSQGGALTLVAAALDPRIKGIAPYVPFLSDFPDYFRIASWPADEVLSEAQSLDIDDEELYETLSYFDVKNFTDRIHCPVLMGFGLQDDVCPPHTNFAAFNNIASSDKSWICFPQSGHHVERESGWWEARNAFFERIDNNG